MHKVLHLFDPRRRWTSRWFRFATYASGTCAGLVLCLCVIFRVSSVDDLDAYRGMAAECHPVWRAFAVHQFSQGDSAAELSRVYPPTVRDEFGRYAILRYDKQRLTNGVGFSSFSVASRDGRLIAAGANSCSWRFIFFDVKDQRLDREYLRYHEAHIQERKDM